jgi:exonuclease V
MQGPKITGLAKINKVSIPVKDIALQQWCEKQMELYHTARQYSNPAMMAGAAMHEAIQARIQVKLPAEPVTYHDRLYKWAYEDYTGLTSLPKNGYCREIRIYGEIGGFRVAGSIDELRIIDGKVVVVEDKTIKPNAENTSVRIESDRIQLAIYKRLVDEMRNGKYTYENFAKSFGIIGKTLSPKFLAVVKDIGVKDELQTLEGIHRKMFEAMAALPEISNTIELRYIHRDTEQLLNEILIPYDASSLDNYLNDAMKYWSGDREARPVAEKDKWRCQMCTFFGKECKTWWPDPGVKQTSL